MNLAINPKAPVFAASTIEINAPLQTVWLILTGINDWASWQPDILKPKLQGPLTPGTRFTWKTGGLPIHSKIHTVEPKKEFGWSGNALGLFAIHNWSLRVEHSTTIVAVEESMQGWAAALFSSSFNKNLEKGMNRWLQFLKAAAERAVLD